MQTRVMACRWRRRGAQYSARQRARKRERRERGFLSPGTARLRRCLKRTSHRHTRRTIRAGLRAHIAARAA